MILKISLNIPLLFSYSVRFCCKNYGCSEDLLGNGNNLASFTRITIITNLFFKLLDH